MSNFIKWLFENGFNFKKVTLTDGKPGIMIDTDYEGLYPTKECFAKQAEITAKVRRFKGIKVESRGHYTGLLVTEA